MKLKAILLSIVMLVISGCASSLKRDFDCPGMPGVQCKSIPEVNSLVDSGLILKGQASSSIFLPAPKNVKVVSN